MVFFGEQPSPKVCKSKIKNATLSMNHFEKCVLCMVFWRFQNLPHLHSYLQGSKPCNFFSVLPKFSTFERLSNETRCSELMFVLLQRPSLQKELWEGGAPRLWFGPTLSKATDLEALTLCFQRFGEVQALSTQPIPAAPKTHGKTKVFCPKTMFFLAKNKVFDGFWGPG